jgi:aquaporin Z
MVPTTSSYFGEFFGAFLFILSIFLSNGNPFVIGGVLAVIIYFIAGTSGGHVNPAVSLAMYLNGVIKAGDLYTYMIAQLLGGAAAFYTYKKVF